jgi:hypothetical protein
MYLLKWHCVSHVRNGQTTDHKIKIKIHIMLFTFCFISIKKRESFNFLWNIKISLVTPSVQSLEWLPNPKTGLDVNDYMKAIIKDMLWHWALMGKREICTELTGESCWKTKGDNKDSTKTNLKKLTCGLCLMDWLQIPSLQCTRRIF